MFCLLAKENNSGKSFPDNVLLHKSYHMRQVSPLLKAPSRADLPWAAHMARYHI
jgi:hypothetical protein